MKTYKPTAKWTDLDHLQELIGNWADKTFPSHQLTGVQGPIHHLQEEARELLTKFNRGVDISEEAADCAILILTIAHIADFSLHDRILDKHKVNENRSWGEPDENGIVHHVRLEE